MLAPFLESAGPAVKTLPTGVVRDRLRWPYVIALSVVHLGALAVFIPWLFSWTGLVVALVGVHIFGMGINVGYHRLLSHGSFVAKKWVERGLVYLGVCCLEDTPIKWVSTHRRHHQHSDRDDDPHSPNVSVFWSHVGWLFLDNPNTHSLEAYGKYARDLVEDPFYRNLERNYRWFWIYVAHALLFWAVGGIVGAITAESMKRSECRSASLSGASFCGPCSCGTSPGRSIRSPTSGATAITTRGTTAPTTGSLRS